MPTLDVPKDFGLTEEHELLRDAARRFLTERCTIQEVRRLAEDAGGFDPGLWQEIAELGWLGLTIPEQHGGAGLGALHLALLLEEMGRCLLPAPYLSSVLVAIALERAGSEEQKRRLCAAIASGDTLATLALTEPEGSWEPEHVAATAEPIDGGFVLRGRKTHVQAGEIAGLIIAPFRETSGEIGLFAVELPTKRVSREQEIGVDGTRRTARVDFEGVRVGEEARLPGGGLPALRTTHVHGHAALAAEMVGAAESTLHLTRDYAIDRKQFDRQIGSFQGVKYPIVDMMVDVELSRTHALAAAAALDCGSHAAATHARMAKAVVSDAFASAVGKAVQIHGGYGFTWDCDVHLYFKRALWSRATLGDAVHHRRHLADELFSSG
jgi:alkylation response protein AidB-like acyl-CoA dehydrogenase